jgi:hypothetical protein
MNFWLAVGILIVSAIGSAVGSFVKAYLSEKGKQLATRQDIEDVLEKVKAVTREQETIKAEIAGGLWSRQTLWNQKRELYGEILNILFDLRLRASDLLSGFGEPNTVADERFEHLVEEMMTALGQFTKLRTMAVIFLGPEANEACQRLVEKLRTFPRSSDEITKLWIGVLCDDLEKLRNLLVDAAKKDLQVETQERPLREVGASPPGL